MLATHPPSFKAEQASFEVGHSQKTFHVVKRRRRRKKLLCILVNTEEFDLIRQEVQKVTVDLVVGGAFFPLTLT